MCIRDRVSTQSTGGVLRTRMEGQVAEVVNYVPGPALDYSFMELEAVIDCLEEEPRSGVLSLKSRLRQVEEPQVKVVAAGGKKKPKPRVKSQYEVTAISTCLRLCNNSLPNLDGLNDAIEELFDHPDKISWLDVSFNQLKTIDLVIMTHTNLKSLYLQGNQIKDVREVILTEIEPQLVLFRC
eukprot:TRINITY_DN4602_c0_g1_i4.p1 TRINITY_DN4602_c0_g1~~TRINITY_DN4602_c0_g1_i4.p1  ORF type:complete len:182 (+),score=39.06 TRINITY_DN4602_c0_g1_i4:76-621(+)